VIVVYDDDTLKMFHDFESQRIIYNELLGHFIQRSWRCHWLCSWLCS